MCNYENEIQYNSNCIPIVIGITGHRDIVKSDEYELRSSIRKIFDSLKSDYPNSTIVVLSALAEGADFIAADEAIKSKIPVRAPLPMPVEEYEKDFTDKASLLEFRRLLAQCEAYYVVNDSVCEDNTNKFVRPYCYRNTGIHIATHCHILIALWDGIYHIDKIGGTSEIVKFKLEGMHPSYSQDIEKAQDDLLLVPNRGAVYHILTPRKSNASPVGKDFSLNKLFLDEASGDCKSPELINQVLSRIDEYNKDVSSLSPSLSKDIEESKKYVIDDTVSEKLSAFQHKLLNSYATADQLSMHFRNKRLFFLKLLMFMGLSLVLLFLLYDELESNIMLPLYIMAFIGVYISYFLANKRNLQNKYVDYRALAEGLKVQLYWSLCNVKLNASEHYRFSQLDELAWIRYAITGLIDSGSYKSNNISQQEAFNMINKSWIKGQDDYFRKASHDKSHLLNKHEAFINILFASSILILLAITFLEFINPDFMGKVIPVSKLINEALLMHYKMGSSGSDIEYQELFVRSIFKIVLAIIAALIAFISNFNDKLALSEQVKNYIKMGKLFEIAREHFADALRVSNYKAAQKIVFQLGKEALAENANWVLLHRERPLEVPK